MNTEQMRAVLHTFLEESDAETLQAVYQALSPALLQSEPKWSEEFIAELELR